MLLLLSHWQLPAIHVWVIAAFFSVAMNFTYLHEAVLKRESIGVEASIAGGLIVLSVAGLLSAPLLIIAAIFLHGCWDLAKHVGRGVPFYFWYTCSCFVVDTLYSAALLFYWFSMR